MLKYVFRTFRATLEVHIEYSQINFFMEKMLQVKQSLALVKKIE